jgi:hypothetical protein
MGTAEAPARDGLDGLDVVDDTEAAGGRAQPFLFDASRLAAASMCSLISESFAGE